MTDKLDPKLNRMILHANNLAKAINLATTQRPTTFLAAYEAEVAKITKYVAGRYPDFELDYHVLSPENW